MTTFYMKIIEQNNEKLIAACDKEIMGLIMSSHGVEIKVSKVFYGDELVTEKDLLEALRGCTSANVIGTNIVDLLIKRRMINKEAILWIDHPHEKKRKVGHAILIK